MIASFIPVIEMASGLRIIGSHRVTRLVLLTARDWLPGWQSPVNGCLHPTSEKPGHN
ncbi:hypothetical protein Brsp01_32480 [Brucella sp. NBRC 12950]|nr:hypothetical protein Brsp01_32480 [Brucella sp. NBRC 12950]